MAALHASKIESAIQGYNNIKRLKAAGYGDSRVTGLTTVAGLKADIATFRDSAGVHQSQRPIFDAAIESVAWAESEDVINDTLVAALTTVATDATAATTDLSYIFWSVFGFPQTAVPRTTNDLTSFPAIAS